jgi:hypothetical protein
MLQYQQEVKKGVQLPYHTMTWSVTQNEHICLHTHINIFLDNYEKWVRHIQTLMWYCRFEEKSIPSDNLATTDGNQNTPTETGNTTVSITFHYCQKKQGNHLEYPARSTFPQPTYTLHML